MTASLQAVAVSYPMLVFLRFLLGIGEAGFTGVPFFLSFFYKRNELAYRTAMFVAGRSEPASLHRDHGLTNLLGVKPPPLRPCSLRPWPGSS